MVPPCPLSTSVRRFHAPGGPGGAANIVEISEGGCRECTAVLTEALYRVEGQLAVCATRTVWCAGKIVGCKWRWIIGEVVSSHVVPLAATVLAALYLYAL